MQTDTVKKKMIKYNWFFEQSPESVWKYLTTPDLLAQWLMKNDFKPVLGHKFMFKTSPYPAIAFDGNVYCEVLEIEPQKKLVYSWKLGESPEKINTDTIVTWFLIPKKGGTELILEHTGFDEITNAAIYQGMDEGWDKNVRVKMGNLFNTTSQNETKID